MIAFARGPAGAASIATAADEQEVAGFRRGVAADAAHLDFEAASAEAIGEHRIFAGGPIHGAAAWTEGAVHLG